MYCRHCKINVYYRHCKIRANSDPLSYHLVGIYCSPLPTYMDPFLTKCLVQYPFTALIPSKIGHYDAEGEKCSCPQSDRFNRDSQLDNMWERDASNIRGDYCRESCPLFRVLRHRTPNSPICLSEEIHKPFALSRVFLLSCGGKSIVLVKKKAPSRSGFSASMYVVLKTRHANPNIHARRY